MIEHAHHHDKQQHCPTCSCSSAGAIQHTPVIEQPLPPPLPEPKYSVYKRILPPNLTHLALQKGRNMLMQSLLQDTANSYWSLTEHGMNQSDPAYCGITTLLVILNSMAVDPQTIRWRGGWRYYANEDVLLGHCCFSTDRIQRVGITMEEFQQLANCQGVSNVQLKRPTAAYSIDDFRSDVKKTLCATSDNTTAASFSDTTDPTSFLVVSFSRAALGQTGDGHFSPVAAYHEETDSVLVLDVARFKYPPYWVSLHDIYHAMVPLDPATNDSRGWFVMESPVVAKQHNDKDLSIVQQEQRRPAHLVPLVGQPDICPIGKVKVEYCKAAAQQR
jgi:glutathione gamma-glutamylcysteinyltransferase